MKNQIEKIILCDLDDTLIATQKQYDVVTFETCDLIKEKTGVSLEVNDIIEKVNEIDLQNVGKYSINIRYIKSFVQCYITLCNDFNLFYDEEVENEIYVSAAKIFDDKIPLIDGAFEFIHSLKSDKVSLEVLTLGIQHIQEKRLNDVGLFEVFDVKHITEASKKIVITEAIEKVGKENVVMIGNSLSSDIKPSLEAGVKGLHIPRETWAFDYAKINENDPNYVKAANYSEALSKLRELGFILKN